MTWTYTPTLVDSKDRVRFLSGDVLTTDQQVSDEEIAGLLSMYTNVYSTAAAVCRHLAARYSRQADQAIDDMRKNLSQRAQAYAARATELDEQASSSAGGASVPVPFAGGLSRVGKRIQESDTDRVAPLFGRDNMEFRRRLDEIEQ